MASPFVYFAGQSLSPAELAAARLDGHVVEIGDAYMPADAVETMALRAASLTRLLGDALAATHLTAAWVHGAIDEPPARHTVQRACARRIHQVTDNRLHYRDLQVSAADVLMVAGAAVTTPVRTLADLVRVVDDAHLHAAARMARAPGLAADAIAWLEASGPLHHKRTGLRVLRGFGPAQDDVTR